VPSPAGDERHIVDELWFEVLGVAPESGVSLLDQGGDSMLATQLAVRLSEALGSPISVRTVLERLTPDAIAAAAKASCEDPNTYPRPAATGRTIVERALSFSEERMWFMHAIAPESMAYNIHLALRLRGPLHVAAMRTAISQVLNRHPVLRSNYFNHIGGVTSVVQPVRSAHLQESWIDSPETMDPTDQELSEAAARLVHRPFDLANEPLVRKHLIHVKQDDALLLLVVHHIIGDQWSFDVISRELAACYAQATTGVSQPLPEPTVGYREYAAWHRSFFRRTQEKSEVDYWTEQLAGLESVSFHPDKPRPPQKSYQGERLRFDLCPRLVQSLRAVGSASDATLAMVMLAGLTALLHRHTGSSDIGIGVPIANRHHPNSQEIVGTLLNTLVLRSSVDGQREFSSLLAATRDSCLDAYEHQDMPFEQLVKALRLPRETSRSPLFGVMFNMLNTPLGKLEFPGLRWERLEIDRRAAQFDLTVTVDADYDRSIVFEYATDLYSRATIDRIARHYMAILEAVAAEPHTLISALPIVTGGERARLQEWGTGTARPIAQETLPEMLRAPATTHASEIAVRCGVETLTYEELDRAVLGVARRLRARGIGRGKHVGLCLDRSTGMLVAQLAVARSGAAWVPLDSAYPTERLAFMAQDAGLDLLISETALAGRIPWPGYATLLVDALPELGDNELELQWDSLEDPLPEDPAYLIYTSGSTGRPKGVVIPHRAVCNFLYSMARKPGIRRGDRLLAVTTPSFDISVLELLLPLTQGAQVVIAEQPDLTDGLRLRHLLEKHAITILQATPSTWKMLLDAGWRGSRGFRALVGGEPLPQGLATALLRSCSEVWNMYGPTETTVWSGCWRIDEQARRGRISLGQPIDNTSFHVLDYNLQHCPIGVPGELFIGGMGIAAGYHHRPELDSERFIPDPFHAGRNVRLYRTGDLVRWHDDGHLDYMGRLDLQVKVRGHRIELGEIEARLTEHPEVAGGVVIVREERPGDARLSAYVVPRSIMPEPNLLRGFLRETLPEYMVPQHFVELDAIPLLPNGKVNRNGLPAASAHLVNNASMLAPRNSREQQLKTLWQEVLGVEQLGVNDDFFDLGGHSMLAVRLVGRIREAFAPHCTLPMLFRNPTIEALARALARPEQQIESAEVIPLQPLGTKPPLFCLCGIHIYGALAEQFAPDRPVYGVFVAEEATRLAPGHGEQAQLLDIVELATRYLDAIRQLQPTGPFHLVGFSFGGVLAFEVAQQLRARGEQVGLLAIIDSDVPGMTRDRLFFRIRRAMRRLVRRATNTRVSAVSNPTQVEDSVSDLRTELNQGYLSAMRLYDARPYPGSAVFFEASWEDEQTAYGWERLIADLSVRELHGDHLGVLEAPAVESLSQALKERLDTRRT
jgi:amino acid adenylation domain-containing protein